MPKHSFTQAWEVFIAFLRLGLSSFGGPVAHLGYLRQAFVDRRQWLSDAQYAQLIALCQFLPGPASSQAGFSIGLLRAGWRGGVAAFIGFTAPSALLLFGFALLLPALGGIYGAALIHGFKLVAVAVVAHGLYGMAQRLTPDLRRALLAGAAAVAALCWQGALPQLAMVLAGGLLGTLLCRGPTLAPAAVQIGHGRRSACVLLVMFSGLLIMAIACPPEAAPLTQAAAAFYRSGALVFGGGHVVLPLLQQSLVAPGLIDAQRFLAGYGAAQAVPGPMFAIAAYLGAGLIGVSAPLGAAVCLVAAFLPGLLLVAGSLPFWQALAAHPRAGAAAAGINAVVVGLLAAALYDPLASSALLAPADWAIAGLGTGLLFAGRSALWVLAWSCAACLLLAALP